MTCAADFQSQVAANGRAGLANSTAVVFGLPRGLVQRLDLSRLNWSCYLGCTILAGCAQRGTARSLASIKPSQVRIRCRNRS